MGNLETYQEPMADERLMRLSKIAAQNVETGNAPTLTDLLDLPEVAENGQGIRDQVKKQMGIE